MATSDDDDEAVEADDFELETKVDEQGRTVGVFKSKPKVDKKVAYFVFDRDSREEAEKVRYLNSMGAIGVLEAQAKGSHLKAAVDKTRYEYALFISENPWAVPGYGQVTPPEPKRWFSGAVLFATVLLCGVVVAVFIRSSPAKAPHPTLPPAGESAAGASPPPQDSAPPRRSRVGRTDSKVIANVY